jgi:hypothetical protein
MCYSQVLYKLLSVIKEEQIYVTRKRSIVIWDVERNGQPDRDDNNRLFLEQHSLVSSNLCVSS